MKSTGSEVWSAWPGVVWVAVTVWSPSGSVAVTQNVPSAPTVA